MRRGWKRPRLVASLIFPPLAPPPGGVFFSLLSLLALELVAMALNTWVSTPKIKQIFMRTMHVRCMLALVAVSVFAGLLIYAACFDVARLIIPNWVCIALAIAFPIFALANGVGLDVVGLHFGIGLAMLAIGFFLFQGNIIGGGDAKLLAATAMWAGWAALSAFLFWTAISGGVLAAALAQARMWAPRVEGAPSFVNKLLTRGSAIPYGVAIMCGGLMAIPALPFVLGR